MKLLYSALLGRVFRLWVTKVLHGAPGHDQFVRDAIYKIEDQRTEKVLYFRIQDGGLEALKRVLEAINRLGVLEERLDLSAIEPAYAPRDAIDEMTTPHRIPSAFPIHFRSLTSTGTGKERTGWRHFLAIAFSFNPRLFDLFAEALSNLAASGDDRNGYDSAKRIKKGEKVETVEKVDDAIARWALGGDDSYLLAYLQKKHIVGKKDTTICDAFETRVVDSFLRLASMAEIPLTSLLSRSRPLSMPNTRDGDFEPPLPPTTKSKVCLLLRGGPSDDDYDHDSDENDDDDDSYEKEYGSAPPVWRAKYDGRTYEAEAIISRNGVLVRCCPATNASVWIPNDEITPYIFIQDVDDISFPKESTIIYLNS